MAVVMRLARRGRRNAPFYHLVVADGKMPRDGRFIEVLGTYDPTNKTKRFSGKAERVKYWVEKGAVVSETAAKLISSL